MSNSNILKKGTLLIGKVSRHLTNAGDRSPRNCQVTLEFELLQLEKGIEFSMTATVWNDLKTDFFWAGQCCGEVVPIVFKHGKPTDTTPEFKAKVERMVKVWEMYHLNGMKAGTEGQMQAIYQWRQENDVKGFAYTEVVEYLKSIDLYEVEHEGAPYKYGTSWLLHAIPQNVIEEIMAW